MGWLTRKAIGLMTLTLIVTESTDANGTVHIDISQLAGPGLTGTKEKRHIPPNGEKEWRDHEDHIFGHVKGTSIVYMLLTHCVVYMNASKSH